MSFSIKPSHQILKGSSEASAPVVEVKNSTGKSSTLNPKKKEKKEKKERKERREKTHSTLSDPFFVNGTLNVPSSGTNGGNAIRICPTSLPDFM